MQNLGLVLLVFSFCCFTLACFQPTVAHYPRLIAAGLAFLVAADLFGGIATLQHIVH